jgi:hypothetical protein
VTIKEEHKQRLRTALFWVIKEQAVLNFLLVFWDFRFRESKFLNPEDGADRLFY